MADHECNWSAEARLEYALKITKVRGDEFDLRKFNPSTYGFGPNAVPSEVLVSNPYVCPLVHVKSCGTFDMYSFALYADGACLGNGTPEARASVGVYGTPGAWYNQGYPLTLDVPQTNQSAEILSAIVALEVARAILQERWENFPYCKCFSTVLLVMDSSYVVQAMSDWIRKWQANGFRNARGERVANTLDNEVRRLFEDHNVMVRFWQVPRIHNSGADRLAAEALRG